jgi:hypothetical protein
MDNVRHAYQKTVQTVSGIAGPAIDIVKCKVAAVAGAAQNHIPLVLVTSYGVCTPMTSSNGNLIHFLMLGAPCRLEQVSCHR